MDSNQKPTEIPQVQVNQVKQPDPMAQIPNSNISQSSGGDSKKMFMFLITGIIVIFLVVGSIYFYLSKKQNVTTAELQKPAVSQTNTNTPANQPDDPIQQDINSINTSSIENSMSEIDQEIKAL